MTAPPDQPGPQADHRPGLEAVKTLLRERSGNDTIQNEPWVFATFSGTGMFEALAREGRHMDAARRLRRPVHQRCHEVALGLAASGKGDWWLGFGFGVVDKRWCWFLHSWLTEPGASDGAIELTTSQPKSYFGFHMRDHLTQAMKDALAEDPPKT